MKCQSRLSEAKIFQISRNINWQSRINSRESLCSLFFDTWTSSEYNIMQLISPLYWTCDHDFSVVLDFENSIRKRIQLSKFIVYFRGFGRRQRPYWRQRTFELLHSNRTSLYPTISALVGAIHSLLDHNEKENHRMKQKNKVGIAFEFSPPCNRNGTTMCVKSWWKALHSRIMDRESETMDCVLASTSEKMRIPGLLASKGDFTKVKFFPKLWCEIFTEGAKAYMEPAQY